MRRYTFYMVDVDIEIPVQTAYLADDSEAIDEARRYIGLMIANQSHTTFDDSEWTVVIKDDGGRTIVNYTLSELMDC